MGGLLHLFDFNQGSMARKLFAHKRHSGGLEAPRNSLEMQVDSSQSYCAAGDIPVYSYQVEEECYQDDCYQNETSVKKLIHKEISKRPTTRQNAPNIVARLMGMDMLPSDVKSATQQIEKNSKNMGISETEKSGKGVIGQGHSYSSSWRQMELSSLDYNKDEDDDAWSSGELGKSRPREHPQEEELQKFKKEFEAWRAARFNECSKVGELGSIHKQLLAEEDDGKEKREMCANSQRGREKAMEPNKGSIVVKGGSYERNEIQPFRDKKELFLSEQKRSIPLRSRTLSRDFEQCNDVMCSDQKLGEILAPTRIVVLKPGPDRIYKEEYWTSSSETVEEKGSIEDFLEEVKERLKCELQGETLKRGTVVRGSGIETPFNENPSVPKKIARHIANQVRESVTRDMGMNLLRSESTRSYRSEIQFNGPDSPEFINRHTRRFWSERLRNVLKKERDMDIPIVLGGNSRVSDFKQERLRRIRDKLKARNEVSYWEIVKDEQEMQTRSFRYGPDDEDVSDREMSPRNLIRSLSAPVSGTSFGKLLLEDRHVLTGAHIRRKHEGTEHSSDFLKKQKKEKFNFKEKVSHFRYSFALRGKMLGRKIQSVVESNSIQQKNPRKDIMSGPTVIMNLTERHENSTEVPPSPASVCSSAHEEYWRQADYPSPISTPDVISGEDSTFPQVFREISSNLTELRKQLNQLDSDRNEETSTATPAPAEPEMSVLEDQEEAYIRDLLVASGLYHGSLDKSSSRWDPFAKPISSSAFQEVEESLANSTKDDTKDSNHKLLHDLLNEALSIILGPPVTVSRFRRKPIGSSVPPPPRGRKLLDSAWEIIRGYLYHPSDRSYYSLESVVGRDMESMPWSGLMDEEINAIGREIECLITGDLVEDIVKDLKL